MRFVITFFLSSILAYNMESLRAQFEDESHNSIASLRTALDGVKTIKGLLPICSNCRKIRDDQGYWNMIEVYIEKHTDADFIHGICPSCIKELYPDMADDLLRKDKKFVSKNSLVIYCYLIDHDDQ